MFTDDFETRIDSALPERDRLIWVGTLFAVKTLGPITTIYAAEAGYGELNPLVEWVTVIFSRQSITALRRYDFEAAVWVVSIVGLMVLVLVVELMTMYAKRWEWRRRVIRALLYSAALSVFLIDVGRNLWIAL